MSCEGFETKTSDHTPEPTDGRGEEEYFNVTLDVYLDPGVSTTH